MIFASGIYAHELDAGYTAPYAPGMDVGKALQALMGQRGWSQTELAERLGTTQATVSRWLRGQDPKGKTREKIDALLAAEAASETPDELERVPLGREFGPDPEFNPDGEQGFAKDEPFRATMPGGRPEIDVRPGAGLGQDGNRVAFTTDAGGSITGHRVVAEWVMPDPFFRHELRASPDGTIFMEVIGNSMLPTLAPGDRVIVDTRQNTFGPDAIYVFDDGDGEPRVKSLKKLLGTGEVRIISDNNSYGEDVMSLGSIRIIGRVVGKVSKL